jgi:Flp pilus assembly protein TadG
MMIAVVCRYLLSLTHRFRRAESGNVAVIFAIALLPMIGFVGAAVDYSRATAARSRMQTILDAATLMIAKDDAAGTMSNAAITSGLLNYFNAQFTNADISGVTVTAAYTNNATTGSQITSSSSGTIQTAFLRVIGFPSFQLTAASTTTWGTTKLRVALALDNTGSMSDSGKMSALKTATNNLIDQLSAAATNNGDVYVSIVPFANVVNFGTGYKNSGYIDWSNWSTSGSIEEGWTCSTKYNARNQTMICGSSNNSTSTWNGCVMDRTQSYDVQVTAPTSTATYYPADQSSYCPTPIAPLSYSWSSLKSTVSAMTPLGGTNQPIGLVWAWQTLQQSAPFNAPAEDSNYTYTKAIVLLSDGLNTMDRWYGNGSTQSPQVDARQQLLCDNIKAAGVTIYTIQVNTGGDPTSTILQSCASGSSNFFMLTDASQVISTFNSIGTSLTKLRVSK